MGIVIETFKAQIYFITSPDWADSRGVLFKFTFFLLLTYPAEYGADRVVISKRCPEAGVWSGNCPGRETDFPETSLVASFSASGGGRE